MIEDYVITVIADLPLLWKRIKKKKQDTESEGTSSQVAPSVRSPTSELLLQIKCLISSKLKFIRASRTRKKLILCTALRADQTLKMVSQQKRLETFSLLESSSVKEIQ